MTVVPANVLAVFWQLTKPSLTPRMWYSLRMKRGSLSRYGSNSASVSSILLENDL